jgi:hypothetical protein
MLTENEKEILEVFGQRQLIRRDELKRILTESGINDGVMAINKLNSLGYLKFIEAVGAPCYTITQEGIRALKK